jgi:hypothetical protein
MEYEKCTTQYCTSEYVEECPTTYVETYTKTYEISSVIQVPAKATSTYWVPETKYATSTETCYETAAYTSWVPQVYYSTYAHETPVVNSWVTSYASEECIETAYPSTITTCTESLSYSTCVENVPITKESVYSTVSCYCEEDNSCE